MLRQFKRLNLNQQPDVFKDDEWAMFTYRFRNLKLSSSKSNSGSGSKFESNFKYKSRSKGTRKTRLLNKRAVYITSINTLNWTCNISQSSDIISISLSRHYLPNILTYHILPNLITIPTNTENTTVINVISEFLGADFINELIKDQSNSTYNNSKDSNETITISLIE